MKLQITWSLVVALLLLFLSSLCQISWALPALATLFHT